VRPDEEVREKAPSASSLGRPPACGILRETAPRLTPYVLIKDEIHCDAGSLQEFIYKVFGCLRMRHQFGMDRSTDHESALAQRFAKKS